jgi:hypothetical protein
VQLGVFGHETLMLLVRLRVGGDALNECDDDRTGGTESIA